LAKGEKRKDCDKCVMLKTPSSFAKGSRVRLKELGDCKTCEVTLAEPLPCNQIILEIYGLIPNWDGISGNKDFSVQDIISLFKMFGISKNLWDEYYQKLVFFHQEYVSARNEYEEADRKRQEGKQKLQAQGSQRPRPKRPQKKRK
jgi:hypothetical protein